MKKRFWLQQAWVACIVMFAVTSIQSDRGLDRVHLARARTVRLVIEALCIVGVLAIARAQRRLQDEPVPSFTDQVGAGPESAVTISYVTTAKDALRSEHAAFRRPANLLMVSVPILLSAPMIERVVFQPRDPFHWALWAPLSVGMSAVGWVWFIRLVTRLMLRVRYPRPDSVRQCWTSLTRLGFQDVTPSGTYLFSWSEITDIRQVEGDLFVRSGISAGCYVPQHAFPLPGELDRFEQAAFRLWKSRGAAWEEVRDEYHRLAAARAELSTE